MCAKGFYLLFYHPSIRKPFRASQKHVWLTGMQIYFWNLQFDLITDFFSSGSRTQSWYMHSSAAVQDMASWQQPRAQPQGLSAAIHLPSEDCSATEAEKELTPDFQGAPLRELWISGSEQQWLKVLMAKWDVEAGLSSCPSLPPEHSVDCQVTEHRPDAALLKKWMWPDARILHIGAT